MNALTQIAEYLNVSTSQIKRCEEWANIYFVVVNGKGGRFVSKSVVVPESKVYTVKKVSRFEKIQGVMASSDGWVVFLFDIGQTYCDNWIYQTKAEAEKIAANLEKTFGSPFKWSIATSSY